MSTRRPTHIGYYEDMSQIPEPVPAPGEWSDKGQWHNPAGTLPFPNPTNMPIGVWNGIPTMLVWTAGTAPSVRTAQWRSPVFDLRPEQRAARGEVRNQGTIPIWKPSTVTGGAGGRLWVQIGDFSTLAVSVTSMEMNFRERGHIQDPNSMSVICPSEDITDKYVPGMQDCILSFTPPGEGYPVRYWQLILQFDVYDATLPSDPALQVEGSYY